MRRTILLFGIILSGCGNQQDIINSKTFDECAEATINKYDDRISDAATIGYVIGELCVLQYEEELGIETGTISNSDFKVLKTEAAHTGIMTVLRLRNE